MIQNGTKVYLAAPLFSEMERTRNKTLRDRISEVANVYLPQEDGSLIFELVSGGTPVDVAKQKVFSNDIEAIRNCDVLVIVMDGRSIDEGASFELGFAYALGKTCIGLKTDARTLFSFGDNPMIESALVERFSTEDSLFGWLREFCSSKRTLRN